LTRQGKWKDKEKEEESAVSSQTYLMKNTTKHEGNVKEEGKKTKARASLRIRIRRNSIEEG